MYGPCVISFFFFLMTWRPQRSTRTVTLLPYTTLFRALYLLAFVTIGGVTGANPAKSLLAAGLGLILACVGIDPQSGVPRYRSEEHTSELQSLMRISYAVFCLKKKNNTTQHEVIRKHQTPQKRRYDYTTNEH